MGLQYKINVLSALKEAGYNTYVLKKQKLLSESTIQKLREGEQLGWRNIESICRLLKCQPNDFIVFVDDESELVPIEPSQPETDAEG